MQSIYVCVCVYTHMWTCLTIIFKSDTEELKN